MNWNALKRVLGQIGKNAGKIVLSKLPELAELAVTSPSVVVALWRLGHLVSREILADAVWRLNQAGVADPEALRVDVDNPLWAGFLAVMATQNTPGAREELKRSLENSDTAYPGVVANLSHALVGSDLEPLTASLKRRSAPILDDSEAAGLVVSAYAAAVTFLMESSASTLEDEDEPADAPAPVTGEFGKQFLPVPDTREALAHTSNGEVWPIEAAMHLLAERDVKIPELEVDLDDGYVEPVTACRPQFAGVKPLP